MVARTTGCCDETVAMTMMAKATAPALAVAPRTTAAPAPPGRNNSKERRRIRRCVEVRRKMEALRSLVPGAGGEVAAEDGGGRLDAGELLFRAADYIARLQVQVKVMQLMVDVLEHAKD
uniref:BHLH domain-containing protein n=1 Tax=Oryza brachyantha TaxID=4533 RepID=J3M457_ORYBR